MIINSNADWLKNRDSRTDRAIGNNIGTYRSHSVNITIDSHMAGCYEGQVMLLIAVNILSSWCDNVQVICPKVKTVVPNLEEDFQYVLHRTFTRANPAGNFSLDDNSNNNFVTDTQLIIGKGEISTNHNNRIWIDGSGWLCGLGKGKREGNELGYNKKNPIGPAFAACLGVSSIFRMAIGVSDDENFEKWFSLYDFNNGNDPGDLQSPDFNQHHDIGSVYQLGCGAIGSSFSYLLSLTDWEGQIHLVDYDAVESHNLSASLLFTTDHIEVHTAKVDVCKEALKGTRLKPERYKSSYKQFVEDGYTEQFPPDLILCFANDQNVWSTIQQNYPPLTVHATTTKSWGINFGRHIPIKEWCIMCRFHSEIDSSFVPVCGEAQISQTPKAKEVLASLPFLSPASAIIALSELAKLGSDKYPVNENFIEFSFKAGHKGIFLPSVKAPLPCYVCKHQSASLYKQIIGKTKHYEE